MTGGQPPGTDSRLSRLGTVVDVLSGAIGLGAYIALAGGVSEWVRMAGAGLPASQALADFDPITLLTSGFQTLVLLPVALAALYVGVRVEEDVRRSPQKPRLYTLTAEFMAIATQTWIAVVAFLGALVPVFVLAALLSLAAGHVYWLALIVLATTAGVLALVSLGVRRLTRPMNLWRAGESGVPGIMRLAFAAVLRAGRAGVAICVLVAAAGAAVLALEMAGDGLRGAPIDPGQPSPELVLGAFVVLALECTALSLAYAGAIWLRSATRRTTSTGTQSEQDDKLTEQATLTTWLVLSLVGASVALPLSLAVYVLAVVLAVIFASTRDMSQSNAGIVALALAFALGLLGYQAHSPQRFDRLEFTVPRDGRSPLHVHVALVTTTSDTYVVAACNRLEHDSLGEPSYRSSRPILMRFAMKDAGDAQIVSRRYAFLQPKERSALGVLISMLDIGDFRPPAIANPLSALYDTGDVCGGVNGSAVTGREALRLIAAEGG